MTKFWKNYSLSITLFLLFAVSWIGQFFVQYQEFQEMQRAHNLPATLKDFQPEFWSATLENWQSEFLQLFTFVVLTTYLIHKDSHESRDSQDKMKAAIDRIEKKLATKSR